jgi:endonuclease I
LSAYPLVRLPAFLSTFAKNFPLKNKGITSIRRFMLFFSSLLLFSSAAIAQIPPGYYDPAAGKTGTALQAALHNIIKDHTVIPYGSIPGYFPSTDDKPDNVVWDMYSDIPGGTPPYTYHYYAGEGCGNYSGEGDCFNREHSWPQSWFNGVSPPYSDMFHIYPTDGFVNGKRSNYPYGTVSSPEWTSENGSKLGPCTWPGYTGKVFEPLDEYKGDFARTYFYMSTRYYTEDGSWAVTDMTNKSQLKPWALQMLLHWNGADPVSAKETDRNNAVFAIQDNRNPFIDHSEYAWLIWGYPVGSDEMPAFSGLLTVYPNPVSDRCSMTLPANMDGTDLRIMLVSATGTALSLSASHSANTLHLDLSALSPGVYFLVIRGNDAVYRAKVVKK